MEEVDLDETPSIDEDGTALRINPIIKITNMSYIILNRFIPV